MSETVVFDRAFFEKIDKHLKKVQLLNQSQSVKRGLRRATAIVKKRVKEKLNTDSPEGYPGDVKGKKPLGDTVVNKLLPQWPNRNITAIVRMAYPAGAHAHLVEFGHIVKRNKGRKPGSRGESTKVPGSKEYREVPFGSKTEAKFYIENSGKETIVEQRAQLTLAVLSELTHPEFTGT